MVRTRIVVAVVVAVAVVVVIVVIAYQRDCAMERRNPCRLRRAVTQKAIGNPRIVSGLG